MFQIQVAHMLFIVSGETVNHLIGSEGNRGFLQTDGTAQDVPGSTIAGLGK